MRYDDWLVGCIAMAFAMLALLISMGTWQRPYQLGLMVAAAERFGKPAARCVWFAIAVLSAVCGLAILSNVRPSYASPASHVESLP